MTLDDFLKLPGAKVHDGSGCPVALDSWPAVLFRSGEAYDSGRVKASVWTNVEDCWRHEGSKRNHIIAYREAP